jgi:hypothetical protein
VSDGVGQRTELSKVPIKRRLWKVSGSVRFSLSANRGTGRLPSGLRGFSLSGHHEHPFKSLIKVTENPDALFTCVITKYLKQSR